MRILAAVVLSLVCTVPAFAKDKKKDVPTPSFNDTYMAEVLTANKALKAFANTPCDDPQFLVAETNLVNEAQIFSMLFENIPEGEDDTLQAQQLELYYGFLDLGQQVADIQKKNCPASTTTKNGNGNS